MRSLNQKVAILTVFILTAVSFAGTYSGGTGEPNDPYRIVDANDLLALAADTNDYSKCFILTADVNMAGQVFTTAIIAASTTPFTGTFDGSGHKIINFTINGNDYLGLFGYIDSGGLVKNLGLENCSISGSSYIGGLVGANEGSIINCYSTGQVSGSSYVGGLVGGDSGYDGSITNCYSTGTVSGASGSREVGGLVGHNTSSISNCYATGAVSGGDYSAMLGGLVGHNGNSIKNCYSTGMVSGASGSWQVGGLVGGYDCGGSVWGSFWDIQTSGQITSYGGEGKTTAEMKTKSTFTEAVWDFLTIWDIVEGQTYPFFKCGGDTGTPDDPYRIATKVDLLTIAADTSYYDKCFILTADVNMEGQVFTTAIIAPDTSSSGGFQGTAFTGTFDGNGHKIINVTINGNDYLGLFGYIDSGGSVKNLGLENCSVSGSSYIGGLVGDNDGSISNCYSTGTVSRSPRSSYVGGLVGWNGGCITNCYSMGAVSGGIWVGGLAGDNDSSISDCYSTGTVSGSRDVGGLVGRNEDSISNCYSTGLVSGYSSGNENCVGGLVGENYEGRVNNCYSTGSVTSSSGAGFVGGLVGTNNSGNIINCYSTGSVSGSGDVGGLVGRNGGGITNCYSTGSVSGCGYAGGLAGDNDSSISDCYSTGTVSGNYEVGGLVGCNGRRGSGSISNCYSTGTVSGSRDVGGLVGGNGQERFWGSISNCYSTGTVSGSEGVGGLVGSNNSSISNCYSTGQVSGSSYVGGLVGDSWDDSSITNCYSTGQVSGSSYVGGLVGGNEYYSSISNCYSTGTVSSSSEDVGGLVGENYGSVISSYFLITGGPNNGYGTPLTDVQMKQQGSFVGWDFATVWMMLRPNEDYPRLAWQEVIAGDIAGLYGVNMIDYARFAAHWGQTGCPTDCENADINNDGTVDINDLKFLAENWLAGI